MTDAQRLAIPIMLAMSVIGCDERSPPPGIAKDRIVRSTDIELRVKITGNYEVFVDRNFDTAAILRKSAFVIPQSEEIARVPNEQWPTVRGVHRVSERDYVVTCENSRASGPPSRYWALIRGATGDLERFITRDDLLDRLEELSIGMKSLERIYGNQLY